jgi:hypothetical protein
MTLAELEAQRAAIPDDGALPASTTRDELAAIQQRRALLDHRLLQARNATATLAALPSLDADAQWLAHLTAWRKTLCDELLALPPRIRDAHLLGVQQSVTLSIKCIDFGLRVLDDSGYHLASTRLGQLMTQAGYEVAGADPDRHFAGTLPWFGHLDLVKHRIKDTERRRAAAEAALDEALLDDDVRAEREAEAKARLDALNALPQRKVRGDGSQYDKYPDGRRVEVTV